MTEFPSALSGITEIVARQYSDWVYPKPIDDMQQAIDGGYYEFGTPRLFRPLLWPERRALKGLRVLIAGCGTNQAAFNALSLPEAHITAIDISLNSLQHSQFLKEKHSLDNLTLRHMSLLDVARLEQEFDFIVSTGVLHHLPAPDAGLRALRDVLAPQGMMSLMVYGQSLRTGVYMMQEVFRRMACGQTPEDVALVRATLESLPADHAVRRYIAAADDLGYDSGIVDTFLHPQDRAYTVPQVLDFAHSNGLAFWGWTDPKDYNPDSVLGLGHPALSRIQSLSQTEQWAVVELIAQTRGTHRFLLCHPQRLAMRPDFESDAWSDYVPVLNPLLKVVQQGNIATNQPARLKREWQEFPLNRIGIALVELVNSQRTITEILHLARKQLPELTLEHARGFFALMQNWGHMMFWLKPDTTERAVTSEQ